MTKEIVLSCFIFGLFALVKSGVSVNNTLRCYQCEIHGKDESACLEKDLQQCPSNQAYDHCLTNFLKNDSGHFIIKKCALAPCEFKTEAVNAIFSTSCKLDWSSTDCAKCCSGDGCNRRSSGHSFAILNYSSNYHHLLSTLISTFLFIAVPNWIFSIFSEASFHARRPRH